VSERAYECVCVCVSVCERASELKRMFVCERKRGSGIQTSDLPQVPQKRNACM
jgi:hypothetical protein